MTRRLSFVPLAGLACIYAGMLLGVSFIAVPAKFLAKSSDRAQKLDIGLHTFHVFGWVELVVALALAVPCVLPGSVRLRWAALAVLATVAAQLIIVRPLLDDRIDMIMQGLEVPPSPLHTIYAVLDVAKVVLLLTFAAANRSAARVIPATGGSLA